MRRHWLIRILLLGAVLSGLAALVSSAQNTGKHVVLVEIKGVIGPASMHVLDRAIRQAETSNAEALIIQLDTPGGLVTSMRHMVESILAAKVPVIGYVAPPGAHAASAGTYILYATNIAAMAPGTNIGAATPVEIGGTPALPKAPGQETPDKKPDALPTTNPEALSQKAINDMVALMRSLADARGRNAAWAEKAVREAATLHPREALEQHVIEIIAVDVDELLNKLDGRKVTVGKAERVLATRGVQIERFAPDFVTRLLGILANPNVTLVLMMLGMYGLIYELANPGHIVPGVVGAIALVLGLYALHQLPLDYAGLALLLLGVAFMVAEAFTPAFGVFGVGGLVAFVIGAAMLIDTDIPEFQISWAVIAVTAVASAAFLIVLIGFLWRTHQLAVQSGAEQMLGSTAVVIDWAGLAGHVWIMGERWNATGDRAYAVGDELMVRRMEGLTLIVTALPAPPYPDKVTQSS